MKLAVIPARGGSKRIPRKNIQPFHGLPMIAWPIRAAAASGLFDQIIVSTDDAEIAEVARAHGAATPFVRPPELSGDFAATVPVIAHATQWALDHGLQPEAVCCIYATAPFIDAADLQSGWDALQAGPWDYAFSVTEFNAPFYRAFRQVMDGGLEMFFPEHRASRSQDLPEVLHDAAQFYWGRPAAWFAGKPIFDRHSWPVRVPRHRVQDIDTPEDWATAERMAPALLDRRG